MVHTQVGRRHSMHDRISSGFKALNQKNERVHVHLEEPIPDSSSSKSVPIMRLVRTSSLFSSGIPRKTTSELSINSLSSEMIKCKGSAPELAIPEGNCKSTVAVDFTSIMFLSTGGATVAAEDTPASTYCRDLERKKRERTATWRDYNSYASRLFWILIFPTCSAVYLTVGLVMYFATIYDWKCRNVLTITLATFVGAATLLVIFWSGRVACRLNSHPVVVNRGLMHVFQIHFGFMLVVPVAWLQIMIRVLGLTHSGAKRAVLDSVLSFSLFLWVSAVVGRQRQMAELFRNSRFSTAPKNIYRNTVLCIGAAYIVANIARFLIQFLLKNGTFRYAPVVIVDFICLFFWIYYTYLSRHASAQFSDYNQIRRFLYLDLIVVYGTLIWGSVQPAAYIIHFTLILGLGSAFLLDSYFSLFRFIQYELDPKCARDFVFQPDDTAQPEVTITTTMAFVQSEQQQQKAKPSGLSTRNTLEESNIDCTESTEHHV